MYNNFFVLSWVIFILLTIILMKKQKMKKLTWYNHIQKPASASKQDWSQLYYVK